MPELDSRPTSTVIWELDYTPASTAIPELASKPITDFTNIKSPSTFSRIPLPVSIPPSGVQEMQDEEAGDIPRMRCSAAGPGWDDWNEQPGLRRISRPPSAVYISSHESPSHPQTAAQDQGFAAGSLQQVPRPSMDRMRRRDHRTQFYRQRIAGIKLYKRHTNFRLLRVQVPAYKLNTYQGFGCSSPEAKCTTCRTVVIQ